MVESRTSTSMASLIAAQAIGFELAVFKLASVSRGLIAVNAGGAGKADSDVKVLVGMTIFYPADNLMKPIKLFGFAHNLPHLFSKVIMFLQRTTGHCSPPGKSSCTSDGARNLLNNLPPVICNMAHQG